MILNSHSYFKFIRFLPNNVKSMLMIVLAIEIISIVIILTIILIINTRKSCFVFCLVKPVPHLMRYEFLKKLNVFCFLNILSVAPQLLIFVIIICFFFWQNPFLIPPSHSLLCGSVSNTFTQALLKTFMNNLPSVNKHPETCPLDCKFSKGKDPLALTLIDVQGFVSIWSLNSCHGGYGQQLWGVWILTIPIMSSHSLKWFQKNTRFSSSENIMSGNSSHHKGVNKNSKSQKSWHCQHCCYLSYQRETHDT